MNLLHCAQRSTPGLLDKRGCERDGSRSMQLCHHHDRRVAKNRKLGFRGHVRSSKVAVDWERSCFALVSRRQ